MAKKHYTCDICNVTVEGKHAITQHDKSHEHRQKLTEKHERDRDIQAARSSWARAQLPVVDGFKIEALEAAGIDRAVAWHITSLAEGLRREIKDLTHEAERVAKRASEEATRFETYGPLSMSMGNIAQRNVVDVAFSEGKVAGLARALESFAEAVGVFIPEVYPKRQALFVRELAQFVIETAGDGFTLFDGNGHLVKTFSTRDDAMVAAVREAKLILSKEAS